MEPGDAPYYSQQETALQVQYLTLLSPHYGRYDPYRCTLHIYWYLPTACIVYDTWTYDNLFEVLFEYLDLTEPIYTI
jgi:hypothetical protein